MSVVNLNDVLLPAKREGRAVLGLVVLGWEDARAYVEAAEETNTSIILQAGPGSRAYTPVAILGKMFRHLAEQASVPIVCHIDHATTVEECKAGIEHGFSSVMIDGSRLEISANIDLTAKVASIAKPHGISVEGEVGFVGYSGGEQGVFTKPADAQRFDLESGADALAVSVGNVHLSTEKMGGVNLAALRDIEAVTRMPLVLHGGSGIPLETRRILARQTRVCKFNIGTELRMEFGKALRKSLAGQPDVFDRIKLLNPTIADMRNATVQLLKTC